VSRVRDTLDLDKIFVADLDNRKQPPFPDLGDRWTSKKKEINGQWDIWQTALRLVQGYGRSIRSKEDWAKTYVLDSAPANFVNRNRNIIPDWFVQAIRPIPYDLLKAPL
jgi:Rad3-related DNA helicase